LLPYIDTEDSSVNKDSLLLDNLFNKLSNNGLSESAKTLGIKSLNDSISTIPGATVFEKLSNHYLWFRNRFHYGISNYNAYDNAIEWSPYQSADLLKAAIGTPFDFRVKKNVMFDIADQLVPLLNFIEFDDGKWPDSLLSRSRDYPALVSFQPNINVDAIEAKWKIANESKIAKLDAGVNVVDRLVGEFEIQDLISEESFSCLKYLRQIDPIFAEAFTSTFDEKLLAELKTKKLNTMQLASKLMSIYDLCYDSDVRSLDPSHLPQSHYVQGLIGIDVILNGIKYPSFSEVISELSKV